MKDLLILIVVAEVVILLLLVLVDSSSSKRNKKLTNLERQELEDLRELKDSLRDTAYTHLELDSALATTFIDDIKTHDAKIKEARRKELGK